jgi:hypothetical protein
MRYRIDTSIIYDIVYDIVCYIAYDIVYDIVCDIVYDIDMLLLVLASDLIMCLVDRQWAGEDVADRILTFISSSRPFFAQSQGGSCLVRIAMTLCTMKSWTRSQNGYATSTVQHILSCVGCLRSWLNE